MSDGYSLTAPFTADPTKIRAGTPLAGQNTVGADDADVVLENDEFWPDIPVINFRQTRQIDDTHSAERVRDCLVTAMCKVNEELKQWVCHQVIRYDSLEDIPCSIVDGVSIKVRDYYTAVYATAQAILNHREWAVADTTAHGNHHDALIESADEYQRERWEALQRLRDEPRTLTGAL